MTSAESFIEMGETKAKTTRHAHLCSALGVERVARAVLARRRVRRLLHEHAHALALGRKRQRACHRAARSLPRHICAERARKAQQRGFRAVAVVYDAPAVFRAVEIGRGV